MDESLRRTRRASSVSLTEVARSFGARQALLPISLQIKEGEFVSLLGPSGSGKSTLLRMIAGLETPDQGTFAISSPGGRVKTSFVFQDAALLPWRTVLGNVVLPLELAGVLMSEANLRANEALSRVGLSDAVHLYPTQLSGGMKMRVSVARALISEPTLLLLDEPFAALDERTRFRLQEDLRDLWIQARMTTIFVTHSVSEAVFLSDRAIVLSEGPGRVVQDRGNELGLERKSSFRTEAAYLAEVIALTEAFGSF